jgi:hypothetical protein
MNKHLNLLLLPLEISSEIRFKYCPYYLSHCSSLPLRYCLSISEVKFQSLISVDEGADIYVS